MEKLSGRLATYIISTTYEDLPEEVIQFTKRCILDYFGSAFSGVDTKPVQMIDEMVRELGGENQATLVTGGKSSVTNAAFVNGAASHVSELDDVHKGSILHAATVVIPAALAIGEWKRLSGKQLITAVVVGYEVAFRIGEVVSPSHYYYWHNTATCGTFGATAAATKLLDLDEDAIVHALGSAGTQAAGLWEFIEDGAMSKQLHPGKAAMNGVISALLAEKGFTGANEILEGRRGFFEAMSKDYKIPKLTDGLGKTFKIMENSFKIHASCRHTHHAMDLAIELVKENGFIHPDTIEKITVKTYQVAINITDNHQPDTIYAGKFSLQFCTALALLKGQGGLDQFTEEALWDEEIRSLMEKVELLTEPEIDQAYPDQWGAIIEIKLTTGEVWTKKTDFPKGDPENPVTTEDLQEKFMKLAKNVTEVNPADFAEQVLQLEKLNQLPELLEAFAGTKIK
ncbi:MmgE/PrpD family protein [Oceanobacillus alkalisoli]|uniref:MmgE/PrpD family protein n=1 Tax=Oceanobacillus alkalisoli TaxID=2925113 RepID=UPI001EE42384|nr:MmgE/PrpD family protein [Oceanobacillus alkalisoli]MCG5102169.1 MmgE/PrpD family protein [Oceanobacillus alkalisoli]